MQQMDSRPITQHPLSQEKLEAGRSCLALLDEYKLGVQGAAWIYIDSLQEWRFYVVTSLVDIDGLVKTFSRIERLFKIKFHNLELLIDDVHLGSPDELIFRTMSGVVHMANNFELDKRTIVDGDISILIDHAYIYRLRKAPPPIKAKQARQRFDTKLKELESEMSPRSTLITHRNGSANSTA